MTAEKTNLPTGQVTKEAGDPEHENRLQLAKAGTTGAWIGFWFTVLLFGSFFSLSMYTSTGLVEPLKPNARPVALFVIGAALTVLFVVIVWLMWRLLHESEYLVATEQSLERHRIRHGKVRKEILERAQLGPISFYRSYGKNSPPPHLAFRYKGISTQMFVSFGRGGWPYVAAWLSDQGFSVDPDKERPE
ncbi:MAG: hypothetical protein ACE37E_05170 [Hyphomicrobiales bacterium]